MSLLIGYEMEQGYFGLCCSLCSGFIGAITIKEAQCLMIDGVEPLCFDCDGLEVDSIPEHLVLPDDHFFLGIGQKVFLAEWLTDTFVPERSDLRCQQISLVTYFDIKMGVGVRYTPLVGSLNLNKKAMLKNSSLDQNGDIS